ncbi:hypothetical protein H7J87_11915 [Mycolicibacterium wolinskyi]|uniref:Uncharacterized protein n=1 Tax=Mycolicibacterium wolinskyi TaxID=59750 RepID=A0A1X2FJ67_9MYCO|nr:MULTISPECIES: hypothetical protein [Mycolicibacterium]MCV7286037.1 hypothetical protein [Mycolicibacterium wolinskyi]MCV7296233.1 hypothetical protein [Mycolicibacterium goodii]ORX18466.1 hypothetical protein AWC31_14275 [Mycolicibacterium wolinskyi]
MFFDFQDSDGTPLSRYKVFYADLLSFNVARSAANATVMVVYNQADTWLASAALAVLSLMSSTNTVLSALGDVYHAVFGRVFEIVPPAAVMTLALLGYIAWAFVDRRANIRSLGQDRNRIAVAVVLTVFFSWLLRNPFYLMDRALTWIPNLVTDFLNEQSAAAAGADGRAGVGGYLMDSVIRPVTQSLMYGRPLTGECVHEFSRAMDRGNAPACAPALAEAPQGATVAAVVLGLFFLVLLIYGLVLFVMYLYHVTMAAWKWFALLYFLIKSLFDTKALVIPSRLVIVAAGHTLAAAVVNVFAVVGPALSIAIVNAMTDGEPTFSVILYMVAVIALFFFCREATGAILRRTGAIHGSPTSILNRVVTPRPLRETVADIASFTSRVASHVPMFPGAALLAAGAAAVEGKLRPGSAGGQEGEVGRMSALSDADRETIDGAIDVITVGGARERSAETVTWPAPPPQVPDRSAPVNGEAAPTDQPPGLSPDLAIANSEPAPGRHHEPSTNNVDVASPVVFGGLGPHRLAPEPGPAVHNGSPVGEPPTSAGTGEASARDGDHSAEMRASDVRAKSAAVFGGLGSTSAEDHSGSDNDVDELIAPMVRSYTPAPRMRVAAATNSTEATPQRDGREAVRRSASAAAKRERARYVLAASGATAIPVSADGDPGMKVYMYNDGTRNVVDPAEGEYVMGSRI